MKKSVRLFFVFAFIFFKINIVNGNFKNQNITQPLDTASKEQAQIIAIKEIDSLLDYYEDKTEIYDAYTQRAFLKLKINDSLSALDDCKSAINMDSSRYYPYYLMSLYYAKNKNYIKSISIVDKGLLYCKSHLYELLKIKANCLAAQKRYDEAFEIYNTLLKEKPKDANISYNIGCYYLVAEKFNDAIDCFKESIKYYDENSNDHKAGAYSNIAYIQIVKKKYNKAIKNLEIANTIEKDVDHYLGLAVIYYQLKDTKKFNINLELALQQRPDLKNGFSEIKNMVDNDNYLYPDQVLLILEEMLQQDNK